MKLQKSFPNEFNALFIILFLLLFIGLAGQYSASGGKFEGQTLRHLIKTGIGLVLLGCVYMTDSKFWSSFAYLFYVAVLFFLIIADLSGIVRLGAQRWIDLYFFVFQPSEFMKLALILTLARYYSMLSFFETGELKHHLYPILLVLLPFLLIIKQPDLGTAVLLLCVGVGMILAAGFPLKIFVSFLISCLTICPFGWFFLRDYQKNRILTFLDPDRDPLGTGYHILQSKIAIGSGRVFGKGFLQGTQGSLNFLPEKNTDFIFTTLSEEFGFVGSVSILLLFAGLCGCFLWGAFAAKNKFSRLVCCGLGILVFAHVFVNVSMVTGILPVVGVPLPFLSYGGSSSSTFMISCGLLMSLTKKENRGVIF
ncbi:MAG: rod shape-determining protein RodA [Holosporaceae bacterium]|jgi:rod shape determining protein RodA|nr:rod shape-determining protein RodA [Holosporaceae bacterium]